MANHQRRVYEPSDEVRVFDGAEDEEDVEGSRLPLLIVLALLVLAMFAGVVWLAYTQGVARGRGETPVLTAAAGPEKIAPQQPGGTNVPYQGFKIYEQPAPQDDAGDSDAAPVQAAPAPQAAAPTPALVVAQPAAKPAPVAATPAPQPAPAKPVIQAMTPKPVAAPAAKPAAPAAQPKTVASLIQQAASTPVTPVAKPVPAPATPATAATGAPRALTPSAAAPKPATTAPVAAPAPANKSGGTALQIGAFKSQAEADAAWRAYKAKHAALLTGYGPDVQQADLGDKGTWYRLRIAGFADREVAAALCDRLKADGGGCFLGK